MTSANQKAKQDLAQSLNKEFATSQAAVVLKCLGITVEQVTRLRAELRKENIRLRVTKNTLASRAVEGTNLSPLKDSFTGPTALAYTTQDPVLMAKILRDFVKSSEDKLQLFAGVLSGKLLNKSEVEALADLPSREVLLSRLVGSLQSPYAGLVYTLSGVLRKLVYALDAVRREKEKQG